MSEYIVLKWHIFLFFFFCLCYQLLKYFVKKHILYYILFYFYVHLVFKFYKMNLITFFLSKHAYKIVYLTTIKKEKVKEKTIEIFITLTVDNLLIKQMTVKLKNKNNNNK